MNILWIVNGEEGASCKAEISIKEWITFWNNFYFQYISLYKKQRHPSLEKISPWIRHLVLLSISGVGILQSLKHSKQTYTSHTHLQCYQDISIVWAAISSGQFFLKTHRIVSFETCNMTFPQVSYFFHWLPNSSSSWGSHFLIRVF